jgi:hypothetical protein
MFIKSIIVYYNAPLTNLAAGINALKNLTVGSKNFALGHNAGANITTGSNNVCIGHNTLVKDPEGNNQINYFSIIKYTGKNLNQ